MEAFILLRAFVAKKESTFYSASQKQQQQQQLPYYNLKSVKWLLLHQKGYFHLRQKISDCCYPIYKLILVKILPTLCIEYTVSSIELLMTKQLFLFCC